MDRINWGVIGAGGIADKRTMPGIARSGRGRLVAIAEVDADRLSALKNKYGVAGAYRTDDELLDDPAVEAVYIASPLAFHKRQALKAARAGKHVLIEKPIGMTVREAEEIEREIASLGVVAGAGFMMRFHAIHQALARMVEKGLFGRITSCRALFGGWYADIPGSWRQTKASGAGGALMDMGIHSIDQLQYILSSPIETVAGMSGTLAHHYEVDDTSCLLTQFACGAFGFIDSYFSMPTGGSMIEIYGTRGWARAEGTLSQVEGGALTGECAPWLAEEEREAFYAALRDFALPEDGAYTMYSKEIDAMCAAIRGEAPVAVPLSAAVSAQRVVEAAYRSGDGQAFVKLTR